MKAVINGFISFPETSMGVMTAANKLNLTYCQIIQHCENLIQDGMLIRKNNNTYSPTEMAKATYGNWDISSSNKRTKLMQDLHAYEVNTNDVVTQIQDLLMQKQRVKLRDLCEILDKDIYVINYSISILVKKKKLFVNHRTL